MNRLYNWCGYLLMPYEKKITYQDDAWFERVRETSVYVIS